MFEAAATKLNPDRRACGAPGAGIVVGGVADPAS